MSRHEGVSCDFCMRANFRGKRYKCLVCYDYDLCELCFASNFNNTASNVSPSLQQSTSNAGSTPGGTSTTASASATGSTSHTSDHAMQCILTQSDFELFYAGENVGANSGGGGSAGSTVLQSVTCPICGSMGFTEATLITHVSQNHSSHTQDVVCPLCATLPNGDPNFVTDDYTRHLTRVHASRANSSNGASSTAGGNGGGAGEEERAANTTTTGATSSREANPVVPPISRRRGGSGAACGSSGVFHSGRAILRRRNGGVLNLTSSASATTSVGGGPAGAGPGNGGSGSSSSNNNNNSNHAATTHSSHSVPASGSSLRDAVDPIAELLSQLSGVRRGGGGSASRTNAEHQAVLNSTASHLQQLQWQLQMERQNVQAAARDHLSRIPRRAYGASSYSQQSSVVSQGATTNAGADPLSTGPTAGSGLQAHGSSPSSSTFHSPIFATDLLYDSRYLLRDFNSEEVEKTSDDQQAKETNEKAHGDIDEKTNFVEDLTFSLLKLDMNDRILQTAISTIPNNNDVISNTITSILDPQQTTNDLMTTQMRPNFLQYSVPNHVAEGEEEPTNRKTSGTSDKGRGCQRQHKGGKSSTAQL